MSLNSIKLYEKGELPLTLYHYTSQKGLLGIIKSKSFWATDIAYLNDASEFEYAINLGLNKLNSCIYSIPQKGRPIIYAIPPDNIMDEDKFSEYSFLNICSDLFKDLSDSTSVYINSFICSLSETGDLLSQWRGYCPKGDGFSIGFDSEKLIKQMAKYDFDLCQCIYDIEKQKRILDRFVEDIRKEYKPPEAKDREKIMRLLNMFIYDFLSFAPMLKDKSFKEEKEWRFFMRPRVATSITPPIKYREGTSMIIPYMEVPLAENNKDIPIKEIIIGPTPHKKLSKKSLMQYLKMNSLEEVEVTFSDIPFRNW